MLYPNVIYHLYNHTINKELLFRDGADYARFKTKIRKHLLPFAEVLCYCLMPTHFHFQVVPTKKGLEILQRQKEQQALHGGIRIMLSSYVRYFNAKYERRGSLIRAKTKAKPAYTDFIPEDYELSEEIPFTHFIPYIRVCFDYIHNNPCEAGLSSRPIDWNYSSASSYAGLQEDDICNFELAQRLLGVTKGG